VKERTGTAMGRSAKMEKKGKREKGRKVSFDEGRTN
jgi:hypothetical protein